MMKSRALSKKLTSTFSPNKPLDEIPKTEMDLTPKSILAQRKGSQGSEGGGSNDGNSGKKEERSGECPSPLNSNLGEIYQQNTGGMKPPSAGSFTNLVSQQRPFQFPSRRLDVTAQKTQRQQVRQAQTTEK